MILILFFLLFPDAYTQKLTDNKLALQTKLIQEQRYKAQLKAIDTNKKRTLDNPDIPYTGDIKEFKKTDDYKAWKTDKTAEYSEHLSQLKQDMEYLYIEQKQVAMPDYPIFMAIAEDIGYDATGKPTGNNELEVITKELERFIRDVVEGERYE